MLACVVQPWPMQQSISQLSCHPSISTPPRAWTFLACVALRNAAEHALKQADAVLACVVLSDPDEDVGGDDADHSAAGKVQPGCWR